MQGTCSQRQSIASLHRQELEASESLGRPPVDKDLVKPAL
jgi:hypothetical protein